MGAHSDFLSGFSGREKREHLRRPVRLEAMVLYLKKGLRGCMKQKAVAVDLSEGGCRLSCKMPDMVADHLYIIIAGIPAKIACAIVGRSPSSLNLRFSDQLPTELVERLSRRCA